MNNEVIISNNKATIPKEEYYNLLEYSEHYKQIHINIMIDEMCKMFNEQTDGLEYIKKEMCKVKTDNGWNILKIIIELEKKDKACTKNIIRDIIMEINPKLNPKSVYREIERKINDMIANGLIEKTKEKTFLPSPLGKKYYDYIIRQF